MHSKMFDVAVTIRSWLILAFCFTGLSCSSGSQQQQQSDYGGGYDYDEVDNFESNGQGSNYGEQINNAENDFDEFYENGDELAGSNGGTKSQSNDPELDNSELINEAPLDLGLSNASANLTLPPQNATLAVPLAVPSSAPVTAPADTPVSIAAATPSPAPQPISVPTVAQEVQPEQSVLYWMGYDFNRKEKLLKVKLLTMGRPLFDVIEEKNKAQQPELVIRFYSTKVRLKMRRPLDASEFRSPVAFIRVREDEAMQYADVILTLRENVKPKLYSKRGNVQLSFDIPEKYFATVGTQNLVEYQAEPLNPGIVLPDIEVGSDLPKSKVASVASGLADPAATSFDQLAPVDAGAINTNINNQIITSPVDERGLPVNDFRAKLDSSNDETPAGNTNENQPAEESESKDSLDGNDFTKEPRSSRFSLFAVGQESVEPAVNALDLGVEEIPGAVPIGDATTAPASSVPEVGAEAVSELPLATEVLSETPLQATGVKEIDGRTIDNSGQTYTGKPLVLEFNNAPLSEVLKAFSDQMGANFVFPTNVGAQKVTIKLRNVPWDAALDAILDTYQLAMARVSDQIVRIDQVRNMSDYLTSREQMNQIRMLSEPRKVLVVRLSHAKADASFTSKLEKFFTVQGITNRTTMSSDDRTNTIFIEAPPSILTRAKALIERLDIAEPQVEIVSRLIEVTRNTDNFMGISWGGGLAFDPGRALGAGTLNFPNYSTSNFSVDPGVTGASSAGSATFNIGSLNNVTDIGLRLKMEETRGTTEVLQSNRVTVADRSNATILAGQTGYVKSSSSPVVVSPVNQQGGSGGSSTTGGGGGVTTVNFDLSLNVEPEVTNDGHVRMTIAIKSSTPSLSGIPGADLAANSRSLNTILKKKSGETAVIGGIYDTKKSNKETGIPFLSKLPIIGALFRASTKSETQTELMMLITPTILARDSEAPPVDTASFSQPGNFGGTTQNAGGDNEIRFNSDNSNYGQGYEGNANYGGDNQYYEQGTESSQNLNYSNNGENTESYNENFNL